MVRLFSNRSQVTSKCGKNKKEQKVPHEAIAECVTDVLTTKFMKRSNCSDKHDKKSHVGKQNYLT